MGEEYESWEHLEIRRPEPEYQPTVYGPEDYSPEIKGEPGYVDPVNVLGGASSRLTRAGEGAGPSLTGAGADPSDPLPKVAPIRPDADGSYAPVAVGSKVDKSGTSYLVDASGTKVYGKTTT